MRKITAFLLISLLLTLFTLPVSASASSVRPRVIDDADLLSSSEEASLTEKIATIADTYRFDTVIVFMDDIGASTPTAYADDFFDYNGYGYGSSRDGILLLVNMEERDWYISASGKGIDKFSNRILDSIGNEVADCLSDGNYYEAALTFLDSTEAVLNGEYDPDGFPFVAELIVVIASLIAALAIANAVKRSMNTARKQADAAGYVMGRGADLSVARDTYLYSTVTKVKIESSSSSGSSSHRSSSGRSHSGRGGKF